ncbi:MAG: hypothetical protein PVF83_15390 [Anaerolineales bacterium]
MFHILHMQQENRRFSKVSEADQSPTPHRRSANLWFAWANAQHSPQAWRTFGSPRSASLTHSPDPWNQMHRSGI